MPRGAAPLPSVRQTDVQICYTMAPEVARGTLRLGPEYCCTESCSLAGRRGVAPRCAVLETALVAGPRPESALRESHPHRRCGRPELCS